MKQRFTNGNAILVILLFSLQSMFSQNQPGTIIYMPADFDLNTGNTYDFIELIPQLEVSEEGVISIIGSGEARVKIDDRLASPSGDYQSMLRQIFVELIDYVEINMSTSARNDAEAEGGIVNLVTLGDGLEGTSGNLNSKLATGEKADLGAGITLIKGKWNVQYNLSAALYKTENSNSVYSEHYYDTDTISTSQQIVNTPLIRRLNSNLSATYKINTFNDIEITADYGRRKIIVDTDIESSSNDENGNYAYTNRRKDTGHNHRMGINYSGLLSKDAEFENRLDLTAAYFYSATDDFRNVKLIFNDFTDREFLQAEIQADYRAELKNSSQIETGVRSYIRRNGMNYNRDSIDLEGNTTIIIEDDFLFNENVQAAYFQWQGSKRKMDYVLGLRSEYTRLLAEQRLFDQSFQQKHIYFFPSVQLTVATNENHKFMFNYNRTIRRQRINQMNPFVNDANPLNIHFGNPDLQPSLIGNYIAKYEGQTRINRQRNDDSRMHNWSLAFIFRNRNEHIYRAALASDDKEGVIENSFYNLKKRYDFNIEAFFSTYLFRWWKLDIVPGFRHLYQDGTNINP
ncbi:MAG: TonB-dependent receptor, partial [Bacteroidales bacterium]|nr:TonB-dependent receptor [Bacteroidales bacterium]